MQRCSARVTLGPMSSWASRVVRADKILRADLNPSAVSIASSGRGDQAVDVDFALQLSSTVLLGLRIRASQVMVDKIVAVRRDTCGDAMGLGNVDLLALGRLLSFKIG